MRNWLITSVIAVLMVVSITGCNIDNNQAKVIANQTGLFAAVGWIAADNPSTDDIAKVAGILVVIQEKAAGVAQGKTYTEVIYPEVVLAINTTMEAQYRPLAKAASLSLLGAIDMMFALHPEWKADQDFARLLVTSFVSGAQNGFSLDSEHPAILQARATAKLRVKALATPKLNRVQQIKAAAGR